MQREEAWSEDQDVQIWLLHIRPKDDKYCHSFKYSLAKDAVAKSQPVRVHCTLGIYAQHCCKGFLELRTLKLFLLQGFSEKILLLLL